MLTDACGGSRAGDVRLKVLCVPVPQLLLRDQVGERRIGLGTAESALDSGARLAEKNKNSTSTTSVAWPRTSETLPTL